LRPRALPPDTLVYCGHEYTLDNARFCLTVDPDNPALRARAAEAQRLREAGRPTLPARLGDEVACNPFLRADDPILQRAAGTPPGDAVACFAAIRRRKDAF
jgi:hydroxyacylglutathione hydrolase